MKSRKIIITLSQEITRKIQWYKKEIINKDALFYLFEGIKTWQYNIYKRTRPDYSKYNNYTIVKYFIVNNNSKLLLLI